MSNRSALILMTGVAGLIVGAYLFYSISNSSYTFGCDYLAYDKAARQWLAGGSPYDLSVTVTGDCGTYQYPPSFLLLAAPFTILEPQAATWAWVIVSVACLALAAALLPVPPAVRILTFILAGTSWPMLFAIKVGATGPLLLLVFAAAWRWMDRPIALALATAVGGLAKLQPALLVVWMALTGRWRALVYTAAIAGVVAGLLFLLDPGLWTTFLTTVRTLQANALDVPANFAPASQALRMGVSPDVAPVIGVLHTGAVLVVVVLAARQAVPDAALLVASTASQIVAPVMWDHYSVVVFLPMAWMLARGYRPALIIGVVFNAMLIAVVPAIAYVVLIDATLLAMWFLGRREARQPAAVARSAAAAA